MFQNLKCLPQKWVSESETGPKSEMPLKSRFQHLKCPSKDEMPMGAFQN